MPELPAQLQPQARIETMANRRDWCEYALNGLRKRRDRLRKALGLSPEDRDLVRATHARHADTGNFENIFPVHAADTYSAQSLLCAELNSRCAY